MMASASPAISESEKQGIEQIRRIFGAELPPDLDTDFNLRRWVKGWKGDTKQIETRLRTYIRNRKAFKLDAENLLEQPLPPLVRRGFKYMSNSIRTPPPVNPIDNTVVILYRLEHVDSIGLANMFTPSEFIYFHFAMTEIMLRYILRQEAISGKPSGFTVLYDLHGIHYADFNPGAPHMKLGALSMALQQDYYCDLLHQVVCVRAPGFMSFLWEVMKKFLCENTQKKFHIYTEHKYRQYIFDHIDPSVVPVFYGGQRRDDSALDAQFSYLNFDVEKCCTIPRPVPESEFAKPSWTPKEWDVHHIRPKDTFTIVKSVQEIDVSKKALRWQFESPGNVEFAVYFKKSGAEPLLIHPKLLLCTPFTPEENRLSCRDYGAGDYIFEFSNTSATWFSLKLSYCIEKVADFKISDQK